MKKLNVLCMVAVFVASLVSCSENCEEKPKADADPQAKILARVNDVPINEYDKVERLKRTPHGEMMNPEAAQNVLEMLIRDELIYQKSIELGLDKNPEYRKRMNEAEAQLRAYQRQEMGALYRSNIRSKVEVKEAEAQDYFEKNAKRMQTKFHVWQIFYRGRDSQMAELVKDLKSGVPFEKVAAKQFPNLPKQIKAPWDLGYLNWSQIPPAWQSIIDRLEVGQVSDVIKGPNDRFWVIKLVNKTMDPKITFATEKERIIEILRMRKAGEFYENSLNEMRTKAKIVFPGKGGV